MGMCVRYKMRRDTLGLHGNKIWGGYIQKARQYGVDVLAGTE